MRHAPFPGGISISKTNRSEDRPGKFGKNEPARSIQQAIAFKGNIILTVGDENEMRCAAQRPLLGVKRTWRGIVSMSANDPKRTLRSEQRASLPINQSHNEFYFRDSAKPQFPRTDFLAAGGTKSKPI